MVLLKNLKFFNVLVYAKYTQNQNPRDVLVRKLAFLDDINMDLKKGKIDFFAKGIVQDLDQEVKVFSSFVFIKSRSRKSVC